MTIRGDFSAAECKHTRRYGVPRLFDQEVKLIPSANALLVRANAYRLAGMSDTQLAVMLAPTLRSCASPKTAAQLWAAGAAAWIHAAPAVPGSSDSSHIPSSQLDPGLTGRQDRVTEPIPCRDDFATVAEQRLLNGDMRSATGSRRWAIVGIPLCLLTSLIN